eukprot:gene18643-25158_t
MDLSSIQAFFKIADQDRDGVLTGGEAVGFFSRSGLSTECLGQIWELSSGGGSSLNTTQFGSALRLVSLAQQNGGALDVAKARVVLSGMGAPLPPPQLKGMQQFGLPSYSPQPTGQPTYSAQSTGYSSQLTGTGQQYSPQITGAAGGGPGGYAQQMTGGSYQSQGSPGLGAASPAAPQFPPVSPADIQRYQGMFLQLDTDKDNLVSGQDCFGFFMQWGLDKSVLRDIWATVAGQAGQLNGTQFVQSLYLMDQAKRGVRPPTQLPPGQFPPLAGAAAAAAPGQWSLQSQNAAAAAAASLVEPMPVVPTLPARTTFDNNSYQPTVAAAAVPTMAQATLATFSHDERWEHWLYALAVLTASAVKNIMKGAVGIHSCGRMIEKGWRSHMATGLGASFTVDAFKRGAEVATTVPQLDCAAMSELNAPSESRYSYSPSAGVADSQWTASALKAAVGTDGSLLC